MAPENFSWAFCYVEPKKIMLKSKNMESTTVDCFGFDDEGEFQIARDEDGKSRMVKLSVVDFEFFNSDFYLAGIYAAHHIFVAERYNNYPMIPGLPLSESMKPILTEKQAFYGLVQRLHVQVAVQSGFDRKLLKTLANPEHTNYVVHHLNHNRLDARRENLVCVPSFLNSMMTKFTQKEKFPLIKETNSGYSFSFRFDRKQTTLPFKSLEDARVAWYQLKFDYIVNEYGSKNCRIFYCGTGKWAVVDAMKFAYCDDAKFVDPELALVREVTIKNALEGKRRADLIYSEDHKIVTVNVGHLAIRVRGWKRLKIAIDP